MRVESEVTRRAADFAAPREYTGVRALFLDILHSASLGEKRDVLHDMRMYLKLTRTKVRIESNAVPEPSIPVIFAPNHFSAALPGLPTTSESMRDIALVHTSAYQAGLAQRDISWVYKKMPVTPLPLPWKLPRQVQNAAVTTYNFIPVDVGPNGFASSVEFRREFRNATQARKNLGFFPEGKPTKHLGAVHPNSPGLVQMFLNRYRNMRLLPVAIANKRGETRVTFGKGLYLEKGDNVNLAVAETMAEIATYMPPNLRGPYA